MTAPDPIRLRVVAIAATSLDGKITRHNDPGTAFTSKADKAYFQTALTEFDCSIMGRKTFAASQKFILSHLTEKRLRVVMTRDPEAVAEFEQPGILEFTDASPNQLLESLGQRGYSNCAHLGGSDAYTKFQAANLIDEWWLTIEPRLFATGRPIINQQMDVSMRLISAETLCAGDTLLAKYAVEDVKH